MNGLTETSTQCLYDFPQNQHEIVNRVDTFLDSWLFWSDILNMYKTN